MWFCFWSYWLLIPVCFRWIYLRLSWPSADFLWFVVTRNFFHHKTSRDKVISLSLHISAIFTHSSSIPQPLMTSCCFAHSSPLYAWYDSCSSDRSFASIFFQIPPHGGHPWYWLVVGSCDITPTVDFHHLDICHARHTKRQFIWSWIVLIIVYALVIIHCFL